MCNTINRDASDTIKGFILQKYRAIELAIETLLAKDYNHIYFSIETYDDVYKRTVKEGDFEEIFEQTKNYTNAISFSSVEIKKSLINFFDIWCKNEKSEKLFFAFYTNTRYTKENSSKASRYLKIKLPRSPIIELLIKKDYDFDNVLNIVIELFKYYYKEEYINLKKSGYLKELELISFDEWKNFFNKIDWKFNEEDEEELKIKLIEKIKNVELDNKNFSGRELDIFNNLCFLLEDRLKKKDICDRLIHIAEVENVFLKKHVDTYKKLDKSDRMFDIISSKIIDKRTLKEKILSVCKNYPHVFIDLYEMDMNSGEIELEDYPQQEIRAYKYRIFEICNNYLKRYIFTKNKKNYHDFSEEEIQQLFDKLFEISKEHIQDKSKIYKYTVHHNDILKKIIYILFNECFLQFNEFRES